MDSIKRSFNHLKRDKERFKRACLISVLVTRMKINTRKLALSAILGATTWTIKAAMPGIPLDFAIPGAKIDFGWAPAALARALTSG